MSPIHILKKEIIVNVYKWLFMAATILFYTISK